MSVGPAGAVSPGERLGLSPPDKLAKSAREFEAILLEEWLEKMNQSFVGPEASQDPAHDTISSLGSQAIATALAARGGIGIASMILRQLGRRSTPESKTDDPAPVNQAVATRR